MMSHRRTVVLFAASLAVTLAAAACRRQSQTDDAGIRPERPRSAARSPYLIEGDELKIEAATNLYDVVRIQRPAWLTRTVRNAQGNQAIVVYLDEKAVGTLNILRDMPVAVAKSLQFLTPTEAQLKFGPGHGNAAAIVVETAKS